jgi:hypothetical protein
MLYNTDLTYFFYFAIFNLSLLTIQDFNERKVDARLNYLMAGVMISMLAIKQPPLLSIGIIIAVTLIFSFSIRKYVGRGDITAFSWIIPGLWLYHNPLVYLFFFFLIGYTILHYITIKVLRYPGPAPYYPVILGSFILVVFVNFYSVF